MSGPNQEIARIGESWTRFAALIDRLGPDQLELTGNGRWTVKDHLVHVAAWELSLLGLLNGEDMRTAMGVPGASEELDALNEAIWLAHRHDSVEQVLEFWRRSHEALVERLGGLSDADLRRTYNHYQPNDPRDPADDRAVVEWVAGDTYQHYDEHAAWIDQLIKESRAAR